MTIRFFSLMMVALLAGCVSTVRDPSPQALAAAGPTLAPEEATRLFSDVVRRVEPVAEAECKRLQPALNCDFRIVVETDPREPPNAFQSLERSGRPRITFTASLIAEARNADELAFILGHEAAHHIEAHIPKAQRTAALGAVLLGGIVASRGGSQEAIDQAAQLGAGLGARTFSKEMELEADVLGTRIADRAGYDPVRGALYFARIPDPGDQFLGTHPPNAERQQAVARTAAGL